MNTEPSLSVEEIMGIIRQEIRKRKGIVLGKIKDPYITQTLFDIDDFYKYDDEVFICKAYFGILNREVEEEAFKIRSNELIDGSKTKEELLLDILLSEEARKNDVKILRINKADERAFERVNLALKLWKDRKEEPVKEDEKTAFNKYKLREDREIEIETKSFFKVNDFIKYHDEEFIDNAYKQILARDSDPDGKYINLELLRSGQITKIGVLCNLRFSKEGKKNKVQINGLKKHYFYKVISNIFIIGYLIRTLTALVKLPFLLKHINKLESNCNQLMEENKKLVFYNKIYFEQSCEFENKIKNRIKRNETISNKEMDKINTNINLVKKTIIDNSKIIDKKANDVDIKVLYQFARENLKDDEIDLLIKKINTKADTISLSEKTNKVDYEDFIEKIRLEQEFSHEGFKILNQQSKYNKLNLLNSQHQFKSSLEDVEKRLEASVLQNNIEDNHSFDAMYLAFENKFRGDKEDIKERLKIYLPYIKSVQKMTDNLSVLDVGAGRGEWLSLMKENGIRAKGIDINRVMVALCKESGLDAIEFDVIEFLREQKSNSLSAITGFHIIEHLPFKVLINLLDEALRVLEPGGLVVFETPNPENLIVGACNFYTDPTHINPIPPHTAEFMLEERGFINVKRNYIQVPKPILLAEPAISTFYNSCINKYPDYSVIGYKE